MSETKQIETLTVAELHARFKGQGVSGREHVAVKCPMCKTVQSLRTFERADVAEATREKAIGFNCIGRYTDVGEYKTGEPPGRGCNWTLGGLFKIHNVEVVDEDGKAHPFFDIATPAEAQELESAT